MTPAQIATMLKLLEQQAVQARRTNDLLSEILKELKK